MKLFSLATAIALGIALSVGAQTTTDEQQQQPAQPKGKKGAKVEQSTGAQENVSTGTVKEKGKVRADTLGGTRVHEHGGTVSQSTTVFRKGKQTNERLSLHRNTRERTDTHFRIGTHPRAWWLRTYSIVLLDGCHYYLADNGCWYPAYGFDPSCDYPPGVVYCD